MTENKIHPYGYCPKCGQPGISRERRLNGDDRCVNYHIYPSSSAVYPEKKFNFYVIEIPLTNYEGNGICYQPVYIKAEKSPSKKQVLKILNDLHNRDSEYQEYTGTWKEAIDIIENIMPFVFPCLTSNMIETSEYCVHPKFGMQDLIIKRITFYEV